LILGTGIAPRFVTAELTGAAMWIRALVGLVLVLVGAVWIGQGAGWIHGSFMTGEALWLVIGVLCVVGGAALIGTARRTSRD
jgi:uncharacterized membrane protein